MLAPRLFVFAAALVVVTVVLHRVAVVENGVPVHMPAEMRFTTACVTSDATLTQSFRIAAARITGVTVIPSLTGPLAGQMRFELRAGKEPAGPVRYASTVPLQGLTTGEPLELHWPPVARTEAGDFTLSISRTEGGGCLAFQASAVHAPDARLAIGGRDVYGDLLYQVHADRGTILHGVQDWLSERTAVMLPLPVLIVLALGYGLVMVLFGQWLITVGSNRRVTRVSGRPSA